MTSRSATATKITVAPAATTAHELNESKTSGVEPTEAVVTIVGLCGNSADDKALASNCKTVITMAQFEGVIEAVQPRMPPRGRREFAERYADALVLARKAEELGLDKGTNYEEQMKLARLQILAQNMRRLLQEQAAQISGKDIEEYYQSNQARFEKAEIDRVYIPRSKQATLISDEKPVNADTQKDLLGSEQAMKREADYLHARAIAGEEFTQLQEDAYQVAGIKSATPNTRMVIRRTSLPPSQISVMDLKCGEISSVLADSNGYYIYRIQSKEIAPLNQVENEIRITLRSQRLEEKINDITKSVTTTLNKSYFSR